MNILQKNTYRIVIVDDMPKNIQVIGTILREKGFLISIAGSGSQALKIITQNLPDLILLDVMMPGMDGFETCSHLKKNPKTKDIPVIFLSALSDTIDKVHGLNIGAVDYIGKPVEAEELLARINTHLTIKSLYKALEEANTKLEEKILIRTQDLVNKNKALEKAQIELNKTKNYLNNVINSMPSILIGVDCECKITQWNQEAEKATGITDSKACGHLLQNVFPLLTDQVHKVRQSVRDCKPHKDEKLILEINGEKHYMDITIYPLLSNEIKGAVIRVDDVTERVNMEKIMIQSEKMLTVGGLAAGMAHEINNPLSGILQASQNTLRRISPDLKKNISTADECGIDLKRLYTYMEKRDILKFIDHIREAGKRATKIVDNMLNFSRKSEDQFIPHNLADLIDKTIELAASDYELKKKYGFHQIEILREYDAAMPQISCESSKIQQVIFNILKNGAQAMAEKAGSSRFILRVIKDDNMARIEIEDNGPGMDEATRKRVFEPFFTTKAVGIGTGLGMSVSYFIITENHKGSMKVKSTLDKGTKFIIRLPIKRSENKSSLQ
ncbi:two-component system, NtrC family, sensor kinase [Candidatus Magnetomoraceae bacterium gMMP-13]